MIRVALLALIACGLAGFGTIVWMVMPHGQETVVAPVTPVDRVKVIVSARALRAGSLLKDEDTAVQDVDQDKLPVGYIPAGPDNGVRRSLMGGMVRRGTSEGDVLRNEDVLKPGDHGFLAAVLRPGYRAVTVAVDAVSGAAGLIWPGDRVDLILTQTLEEKDAPAAAKRIAAETVLRDVRVIAIDQQVVQTATGVAESAPARTVTLEVSSASAEQIQVATKLGRLSLALRSAERGPSEDSEGTTWAGDVSSALNSQIARPVANSIKVYGGPGDSKEFKF